MKLQIYTDGSCSGNPGPGGWSCIINLPEESKVISGGDKKTTNNRMELMAVIEALKYIEYDSHNEEHDMYEIYSDSAYVVNAISKWIVNWKNNGWKTKANEDVKNVDLWKEFDRLHNSLVGQGEVISFIKVKGHKGDFFNEMADQEARKQTRKYMEV